MDLALFLPRFGVLTLLFTAASVAWGQSESGLLVRRGADVRGVIEGSLQVVGEGEVQIASGASIHGDLIVPAEKRRHAKADAKGEKAGGLIASSKTVINNRGGSSAVRGEIKTVESFQLPHVHAPKQKGSGERKVMDQEYLAGLDFTSIRDFAVKHRRARVALPPDTYGHFEVSEGKLVLGAMGATDVLRYDFRKLDVGPAGRVEVVSPVVVSIAEGSTWQGSLGERKTTFWLDVRVASGEIALASGSEFHGHLSAPASIVTIAARATFAGGLTTDRLVVEPGAKVVAENPQWNAAASDRLAPALAHKAVRLQREVPKLRAATKSRYFPGVSYIEDVPYVMLARGGGPADSESVASQEHAAVFDAFHAALVESGFSQAGIVLADPSGSGGPPQVSNLRVTRVQFDALATELGAKASLAENISLVRGDPALLEQFMQRTVALNGTARIVR